MNDSHKLANHPGSASWADALDGSEMGANFIFPAAPGEGTIKISIDGISLGTAVYRDRRQFEKIGLRR